MTRTFSECCGRPIIHQECDICPKCKDHCDFVYTCNECDEVTTKEIELCEKCLSKIEE